MSLNNPVHIDLNYKEPHYSLTSMVKLLEKLTENLGNRKSSDIPSLEEINIANKIVHKCISKKRK